ncbi:RNA-binding protein [Candidatus Gracilibacteria bacterium]|nr:RNA-binding protein [Candidatus Gracilibacteria bacterium]
MDEKKKLFVAGLDYGITDDVLRAAFEKAGAVESAQVILDKFTGRSRGFGFVEMASEADAQAAIRMWNEQELEGRKIIVNVAKPREARPPRREGGYNDRY